MARCVSLIAACILLLSVGGCKNATTAGPNSKPQNPGALYSKPVGTGAATVDGIKFRYVATEERKRQILEGFPKLKIGDTRDKVREVLGPPDRDEELYGKKRSDPFHGWTLTYEIKMRHVANTNDVCVQAFFNPDGELHWAIPANIDDLKEIGTPSSGFSVPSP